MNSKLVIGTAQFGSEYGIANRVGKIKSDDIHSILQLAFERGINTLDTASSYGSEAVLGSIGVDSWNIITKVSALPDHTFDIKSLLSKSVSDSMRNLVQSKLYGLLLHQSQDLFRRDGDTYYQELQRLKSEGLITKIGVSVYTPMELKELLKNFDFDIVQIPMNILDLRFEESGLLRSLKERNTEIHARSIFLQGLILMDDNTRPKKFQRWQSIWKELSKFSRESKKSLLSICLNRVINSSFVDKCIVGIDSLEHLKEILAAIDGLNFEIPKFCKIPDEDLILPMNWAKL